MSDLPAILGGEPLNPTGPPDWPLCDQTVRQAVAAALDDASWGKYAGGHVERLEGALAGWLGVPHVATCASGTYAVEAALRTLGVGAGDEVILAGYDYPGNFLSVHALSARPVLVDVAANNWNLDPVALETALSSSTKAVIVSHLHGGLVPMREVMEICARRNVQVIEDAAQCPGATVQGRQAGTWGDVGVWSFGGSKLLSAGRGGALFTSRGDLHQRARLILGRGNNLVAPLSELQAIVLVPQLKALSDRHQRRFHMVEMLRERIHDVPGMRLLENRVEGEPGYYKVGLQYDERAFGVSRDRLVQAMRAEGYALDAGFRALHVGRSASRWRAGSTLEQVEQAHKGCVILHHPALLEGEVVICRFIEALRRLHHHREQI